MKNIRDKNGRFVKGVSKRHSEETKKKISLALTGRQGSPWSAERKAKGGIMKGRKFTDAHRHNLSESLKGKNSGKRPNMELRIRQSLIRTGELIFTGFKSTERNLIMQTSEYKLWRVAVFQRDNWTCIWCGQRGGKLNADHIKPFAYYPEIRFAIDNGRTLCEGCHRTTDTYGHKSNKK